MVKMINQQTRQKAVAMYVIAALLFQIYLLATLVLNPSQVQNNATADPLGGKILICTPTGFKWVDINELIHANNASEPSADGEHETLKFHCPLLEACHFFLLLVATCLIILALWLARPSLVFARYQHIYCKQKVYLLLAPKQSPPAFFA